ncbi:MAG TPA: peroxiredoxin [Pyrinomonadaceae bacterium]|jgi:peroxiredoxin|nr:peroxiredoxin [Pyrinomonadaceae bacterium]
MKSKLKPSVAKANTRGTSVAFPALSILALVVVASLPVNVPAQQSAATEGNKAPSVTLRATGTTTVTTAAPKVGATAPDFRLPYATQEKIFFGPDEQMSLSSQRGKNVILAFYPADWSGGCTAEVCTFRDTFAEMSKLNAVVLGISGDYVFSHHEWAKHHKLQFPLLSDHDHAVAKLYASYNEKYGLNNRTVYLIDKDGVVRYTNLAFKAGDAKDYAALRAELEKLK